MTVGIGAWRWREQGGKIALFVAVLVLVAAVPCRGAPADGDLGELQRLMGEVSKLEEAGRYAEALPSAVQLLSLTERLSGNEDPATAVALDQVALLHMLLGDLRRAEPLYQRALTIRERVRGPNHAETAVSILNLAQIYRSMGQLSRAIPMYHRALEIFEESLGEESQWTSVCLTGLAQSYRSTGEYGRAEALYQRALKNLERTLGPEHPMVATGLQNLAVLYTDMGEYRRAELLYQRALKIYEGTLQPAHPHIASALNNLALLHLTMGEYSRAELLCQRALAIREKALGADHPDTATSLDSLSAIYVAKGDYQHAEPLKQRALHIREATFGPNHPHTAASLTHLAELYRIMDDYDKAEPLYVRALEIQESVAGPQHPLTARSLCDLAGLYVAVGDIDRAEPLYQRAIVIVQESLGPDHPDMWYSLDGLAQLCVLKADYRRAEPLYGAALEVCEKSLGIEHPRTADALSHMANVYMYLADYDRAESLYKRALLVQEKVLGPEHPDTALSLNQLASLYLTIGDYSRAEPLYQRALQITQKTLGPDHTQSAKVMRDLACLYFIRGKFDLALSLCQRALDITERACGPEHPDMASRLTDVATVCRAMGDNERAQALYGRALAVARKTYGPEHPATADILNKVALLSHHRGDYQHAASMYLNALQVRERVLGQEHPSTAESLENLACLYLDEGDTGQARRFAERAGQGREKVLATVLSFTSEAQRLAFRDSRNPYDLLATVGSAPHIAQTLLRQKGVVLDSMMEDAMLVKEGSDPEFDGRVRQVRTAKQHLLDLLVGSPRNLSEEGLKQRAIQREQLQEQVDEMERGLARDLSGLGRTRRALAVTTEQVQSQLPATGELVEFVTYEHFLGNHEWEGRYGAVLLSRDADPVWIPLGPAKAINANVRLCQSIVRGEASADQLQRVLQDLHTQAWAPIEARLPSGTQTVVLGPDGALNFVSFATLVAPNGEFVAEKYLVQYVSSGRDLLVAAGKPVDRVGQGIVVFANPQYDSRPAETDTAQVPVRGVPSRLASASDLRDLGFPPLPSTAKEGTVLAGLARDAGWPVTVYSGSEASKGKLYQTRGARILHFATHGFFLPDQSANSPPRNQLRDADVLGLRDLPRADRVNPMYRSGLAFAGAQVTADAWRQGKEVPAEVNGILTAAEVSTLDLRGTWLVVLSACDTGSGDSLPGEGVLGLRRGFVQAGAQNLLMTLWPVLDEESAQFMGDFYGRILKQNISPARALAETQREWLKRLRGEQGLLHAVRVAGPFVLTSQGGL